MYRVLIVHDVEVTFEGRVLRWAYANRSLALQENAPADFQIDRCCAADIDWSKVGQYDLVFNLDYMWAKVLRFKLSQAKSKAVYVVSFNRDSHARTAKWLPTCRTADWVVANNLDRYQAHGIEENTCCISNGVDTTRFFATTPIEQREQRVIWTGSTGPGKGKGYHEILWPAKQRLKELGFDCDFRPINDVHDPGKVKTASEMREWYNTASYVLCASESEGTPNFILEGMACGCVPITTPVGNVLEFGVIGEKQNVVAIERSIQGVLAGLCYARTRRDEISEQAQATIARDWSWGGPTRRADYFYALFRKLIDLGPKAVKPFSYMDVTPGKI